MNMIRRLHRKFMVAATAAVIIIIVGVLGVINIFNYARETSEMDTLLSAITNNRGTLPADYVRHNTPWMPIWQLFDVDDWSKAPEFSYQTRYYSILFNAEGTPIWGDVNHIAAFSINDAISYADVMRQSDMDTGTVRRGSAEYRYMKTRLDDGSELVVVLDCTKNVLSIRRSLRTSVIFGCIIILLFIAIAAALSHRIMKPFITNMENQKRFITNAGHELKTPIAIISANAEAIEMINGKSEWTTNILTQVKRQTGLINDLITLAKMDERSKQDLVISDVDVSQTLRNSAESFEQVAIDQGKHMTISIKPNVHVKTDGKCLYTVFNIFVDNAVKYCDEGGTVAVSLQPKKIGHGFTAVIANTYAEGKHVDYSRFFERFYRGDESHNSQKSGYGIGLSMADELMHLLKGNLSVRYWEKTEMIQFTISM